MAGIILVCLVGFILGIICVIIIIVPKYGLELKKRRLIIEKLQYNMKIYNLWMMVKAENRNISEYLKENHIHSIAIYGMSDLGNCLYKELRDSEIEVRYGIDQNPGIQLKDFEIITLQEVEEKTDAVIVTAVTAFDKIEEDLRKRGIKKILALDTILYDLLQ